MLHSSIAALNSADIADAIEQAEPMLAVGMRVYFNFENLATNESEYVVATLDELRDELARRTV